MDSFDKNMDGKNQGFPEGLPPGLEWEQMEAGILRKMEALAPQKERKHRRGGFWFWMAGLAALAGLAAFLYGGIHSPASAPALVQSPMTPPLPKPQEESHSSAQWPQPHTSQHQAQQTTTLAKPGHTQPRVKTMPKANLDRGPLMTSSSSVKKHDKTATTVQAKVKSPLLGQGVVAPLQGDIMDETTLSQPEKPSLPLGASAVGQASLPDSPATAHEGEAKTQQMVFSPLQSSTQSLSHHPYLELTPVWDANQAEKFWPTGRAKAPSIQFSASAIYWQESRSGLEPEEAKHHSTLPSLSLQLAYTRPLTKRFAATVGLEYQRLNSRFEWSQELDNIPITLEDTIVRIIHNSLNGTSTVIRGDVQLTTTGRRHVLHHNSITRWNIPVVLHANWRQGAWCYGLGLGGAFNFSSLHQGRTLQDGAVVDYRGQETHLLDNRYALEILAHANVSRMLDRQHAISLGVEYRKSATDWSNQADTQIHPSFFNLRLGFVRYLGW